MLLNLFNEMRAAKVPVSVRELLDLINALKHRVTFADMDEFYFLARTILVKDERHYDKFDRAFGAYFAPAGMTDRALVVLKDGVVAWSWQGENPGVLPGVNLVFDGLAAA